MVSKDTTWGEWIAGLMANESTLALTPRVMDKESLIVHFEIDFLVR